jgi:predicted porin
MKKLLIAASVAAALAPVLAHADVSIYGSIRGGISSVKSASTDTSTFGVDDFSSRIGFKGSEDLGNGLKAIWQLEQGFDETGTTHATGTATGALATRTTFVGLAGDFGTVRLGYIDDVLAETEATDNLFGPRRDGAGTTFPLYEDGTFGDGRVKNGIRYDTPTWNGFNAMLQYGAGEKTDHSGNMLGARLAYRNDPTGLFGAYAYLSKSKQTPNNDGKIQRIEFGYDANNLYVAGTYNWEKSYSGADVETKTDSWAINVAYTLGNWKPNFVYSKIKNPTVGGADTDKGAKQWALGLDYTLSKRTMVEAAYGEITENDGLKVANGDKGNKSSVTMLMLKHNF